jgi:hypothetical protein
MKKHKKLTSYLGICGWFSDKLVDKDTDVTCKECLKIMKKEKPLQFKKRQYVPF